MGSDKEDDIEDPIVAVVVPLYNGAKHIDETLTSIERQSLASVEVIVIDDGSTDEGPQIVRRHTVRATLLEQTHLGVAVARNRGLAAARGRWITFLDQDDLWHPTHLERVVAWLQSNSGERLVFCGEVAFATTDETSRLRGLDQLAGGWASIEVQPDEALDELVTRVSARGTDDVQHHDLARLLRGPVSVTTSFVADPEILRLVGGFAPHALAMDDYWMLVNVARIHPIARIDQPTVYYRVHLRATSRTTRLGLPFLSSAVALRLGGVLAPQAGSFRDASTGDLHAHLLSELLGSPEYRDPAFRRTVSNLAKLLWPPDGRRVQRWRARIALRLPWLRRALRRRHPRPS